jgi:hypothetical protein
MSNLSQPGGPPNDFQSRSTPTKHAVDRSTLWASLLGVGGFLILVGVLACLVSYFVGASNGRSELGNIIALKHVPHTGNSLQRDLYTAIVWTEREKSGFGVFARITIGGSFGTVEYMQDVGRLGTVATRDEAIDRFGEISWNATTMFFGKNPGEGRPISRAELQKHR